ncbi:YjjG family noncanonical pyrimidine nucleotidase [Flammeovirga pacifica]|uniref:Noncanonical pyrimidine nucleotidase, YjjG family n=1 Tax=Flammeovirga pacifica TaxID=915059 RepID=A0A1S1Z646_FLAPC|nr:YjjG family noncanonical pyrimidine nucleotidase [Flammeovirga pacifica]OHX68525.1 noncanonical pyrimidine nucleotidase, YjjG family [Flammeovirga pacifica]
MHKIKHLFFDLDHTLWDFEKNSEETLTQLFSDYSIGNGTVDIDDFLKAYKKVNHELWDLYNVNKVTKEDIRLKRFPRTYVMVGLSALECPEGIGDEYLEICPHKPHLIEGAIDLLEYLKDKYQLHILSNGFEKTQEIKLRTTGLDKYFDVVVTSESCGHKKPSKEIFDFALEKAGANLENAIMIGDNPITDIKGAKEYGLKTIFFGNEKEVGDFNVQQLIEIKKYL